MWQCCVFLGKKGFVGLISDYNMKGKGWHRDLAVVELATYCHSASVYNFTSEVM